MYQSETAGIANSAGKLCVANPLHATLNDGHCSWSVQRRKSLQPGSSTSYAEGTGELCVERHVVM